MSVQMPIEKIVAWTKFQSLARHCCFFFLTFNSGLKKSPQNPLKYFPPNISVNMSMTLHIDCYIHNL